MNTSSNRPLSAIYQDWQSEHREFETCIAEIRKWMYELAQMGDPHFGETATRLKPLRRWLVAHFDREDEMVAEIASSHLASTRKANAMGKQSSRDRARLLAQLDDLMDRLIQLDPPFVSWQRAIQEVEAFVDLLGDHEAREIKSVQTLIPDSELGTSPKPK